MIDAIAKAISNTKGCALLDVDPGATTNRTVYTFVGEPEAVVRGALNAARVGHQLIDMSQQKGAHPRIGAMDVCPFIPVKNIRLRFYLVLSLSTFAQYATGTMAHTIDTMGTLSNTMGTLRD